ncbi:MAG: heparinase II/III family protein [Phycisphaeraceae bacterium]
MIFDRISVQELQRLLTPHMDRPAWPGLDDPAVKERARQYARASGLWDKLSEQLDAAAPIPVFRHSDYRDYRRTGRRQHFEALMQQRRQRTEQAALALWLDHPAGSVDHMQDLLWAWCESTWTLPAHERRHIELLSSHLGLTLAEYTWLFRNQLDTDVQERIGREITQRLLNVALDWRRPDTWQTSHTNWNSVCNANLIQTALYQILEPEPLATFVHTLARRMDYAIAFFTPDGGCPEGASYWEYGFGHFISAALAIHHRTGGAINLADDTHVHRICEFPLAAQLRGRQRASFADCHHGYLAAETALMINRLHALPALFRLVDRVTPDTPEVPITGGLIRMASIRSLALYEGQRHDPTSDRSDYFLPDLGYAKVNAGDDVILAALAGRNDVPHNHNDIGSFIYMVRDAAILCDPGAPIYTSRTFSARRYDILMCRSRGHSVPLINGQEQLAGAQYVGTIQVQGLNAAAEAPAPDRTKSILIDMSRAYADPTLTSLRRELRVEPAGVLTLTDTYALSELPNSIQEAFVTYEPAAIEADGRSVRIGGGKDKDAAGAVLTAQCGGRFTLESIRPEEHEGRDQRPLQRLAFTPDKLAREMRLTFTCTPLPPGR